MVTEAKLCSDCWSGGDNLGPLTFHITWLKAHFCERPHAWQERMSRIDVWGGLERR